ncbi:MAG TPA: hypothetical protein VKA79_01415 [Aestuariivirgaceae bacterium]|nr:hypothetical protein [Aestuariivirgaceae bacterium]
MSIAVHSRYIGVALAGFCAILLTGQPPAYSAREELGEKPPPNSLAVASLNQGNSSEPFSLSDWLSDNGSGGFPENFSDEDRRLDQWDTIPANNH